MVSVNRGNFSVVLQKYIQREIVKLKLKFLISKILLNLYVIEIRFYHYFIILQVGTKRLIYEERDL